MSYIFCALYFALAFMGYVPCFIETFHETGHSKIYPKSLLYKGIFLILTVCIASLLNFYEEGNGWQGFSYVLGVIIAFVVGFSGKISKKIEVLCMKFIY